MWKNRRHVDCFKPKAMEILQAQENLLPPLNSLGESNLFFSPKMKVIPTDKCYESNTSVWLGNEPTTIILFWSSGPLHSLTQDGV